VGLRRYGSQYYMWFGGALRGLRVGYGVDSKCYFSLAVRLDLLVPSIVRY
jgi:hypothetical protein